jgi:DNA repair exonuclease SbcCD ATPase subunit
MLWLADLEVENVRRFEGRWRLAGLGPGLNLLAAPNEAGKSTLLAAIQAAIFRTVTFDKKTAQSALFAELAHRDSEQAAVALAVATSDGTFRLTRTFRKRGDGVELIRPDGTRLRAGEAEAGIRHLFGAAPDRHGVWGALWVEQTRSILPPALDDVGKNTLRDAVSAQAAIVTGERGAAALIADIERVLKPLVTEGSLKSGTKRAAGSPGTERSPWPKSGGTWARSRDDREAAEACLRGLERQLHETEALAEELAELRERARRREEDRPEEALKNRLETLRGKAGELRIAAERRQHAERQAASATALAAAAGEKVRARRRLSDTLARRAEAIVELERHATEAKAKAQAAQRRHAMAVAAHEDARAAMNAAIASHERIRATVNAAELAARVEALRAALSEAHYLAAEAEASESARDTLAIGPDTMRRLRDLADEAVRASATLTEVAPHVIIEVARDGVVQADDETLPAGTRRRVVEAPMAIVVPGVVRIEIAPPGARLARAGAARGALADALAAVGVQSVEEAEHALVRREAAAEKARALRIDLARVVARAGASDVAELTSRLAEAEAELATQMSALDVTVVPSRDEVAADAAVAANEVEAARARLTQSEAERDQARTASEAANGHTTECAARLGAETEALRREEETLAAERAAEPDAALADRARDLSEQAERLRTEAAALPEADESVLAALDAEITAVGQQISEASARREADIRRIGEIEGSLAQLGARGLAEELAAAQLAHDAAARRARQEEERVRALLLLRDVLNAEIAQARADYLPALERHAEQFVRRLFPDASLGMDLAGLRPARLGRNDGRFDLARLSIGTQEQIAILVRLAFARLLRDRGLPVFLVLDDALAYADEERLAALAALLQEEAQAVQIIMLSCREGTYGGAKANRLALERVA